MIPTLERCYQLKDELSLKNYLLWSLSGGGEHRDEIFAYMMVKHPQIAVSGSMDAIYGQYIKDHGGPELPAQGNESTSEWITQNL